MSKALTSAFVAEVGIIGWRNLHNDKTLPPPSQFAGAAIIFGLLGLIPGEGARAAGAFAWVLVLATFLNLWNPNSPTNIGKKAAIPGTSEAVSGSSPQSSQESVTNPAGNPVFQHGPI